MRLFRTTVWPISLVLVFTVSTAMISYASWLLQTESANRAFRNKDLQTADRLYEASERPFRNFPWLAFLLRDDYEKLVFNRAALLYAGGDDEKLLQALREQAERFPSLADEPEYAFWTGNALMRLALRSKDSQVLLEGLKAALAEYQRGLEVKPDDWDLKYNYELVKRLLIQRQGSAASDGQKAKSILEKTQPSGPGSPQDLPPEKRG